MTQALTLQSFDSFGTPSTWKPSMPARKTAQQRFIKNATVQLIKLKSGHQGGEGDWFRVEGTRITRVCLRNGAKTMTIGSNKLRDFPSIDAAEAFFNSAIEACNQGLFDEEFKSTEKGMKTKKND
jgi:hypothetical protein